MLSELLSQQCLTLFCNVLILILLDHALRGKTIEVKDDDGEVLILILLDHALRETNGILILSIVEGLNPYFIGPCSPSDENHSEVSNSNRLNPYFIGPCSPSIFILLNVMEMYRLNPYFIGPCSPSLGLTVMFASIFNES